MQIGAPARSLIPFAAGVANACANECPPCQSPQRRSCQDATNRLTICFKAQEGQAGVLQAFVIPAIPPKTCSVVQHRWGWRFKGRRDHTVHVCGILQAAHDRKLSSHPPPAGWRPSACTSGCPLT